MKLIFRQHRIIWTSLLCLFALLFPLLTHALTVEEVPNPRQKNGGWVTDMANVLSSSAEAELNQMISALEAKNGVEMAVVTVPKTAPATSPKQFATNLFNHWKVGKKGENNGVLFLTSIGDRRAEVETGYGVTGILPNAKVGNILQTEVIPKFKQGQYETGILAGTKAYLAVLESYQAGVVGPPSPRQEFNGVIAWGGLLGGSAVLAWVLGSLMTKVTKNSTVVTENSPIFLEPTGRSRDNKPMDSGRICCAVCKQQMQKLKKSQIHPYLRKPEQVAAKIGSVKFDGFHCLNCYSQLTATGIHICSQIVGAEQFSYCQNCQELTVKIASSEVVVEPTWNAEGKQLAVRECQCCGAYEEVEIVIPCLTLPSDAILLEPEGRSRLTIERPTHCNVCHYPMEPVNTNLIEPFLTKPEKVAQKIGSKKIIGWSCPNCSQELHNQKIHIASYRLSNYFDYCPQCKEFTIACVLKSVEQPTYYNSEKCWNIKQCQCCSYSFEEETIRSTLTVSTTSTTINTSSYSNSSDSGYSGSSDSGYSSGSDSSYSSSSDSGYSSSSDSGYSGSSDFGGGSSGGDGGGGSW